LFNDLLLFNGKKLQWVDDDGNIVEEWDAISGRPGGGQGRNARPDFTGLESQGLVGRGPIPEGEWLVKQSQLQIMGDRSIFESIWAEFGGTAWPGGESAWGKYRIWLEPASGTNTYGRSGFSIHGGAIPGSAGCIDLCGSMPSFEQRFKTYGRDMGMIVQY
jgi:hypothetical protein